VVSRPTVAVESTFYSALEEYRPIIRLSKPKPTNTEIAYHDLNSHPFILISTEANLCVTERVAHGNAEFAGVDNAGVGNLNTYVRNR